MIKPGTGKQDERRLAMIAIILDRLKDLGLAGLYASMFLEGSSLPFPGIAIVITYGYLFPLQSTLWIAAVMSVIYSLASLIPYFFGRKLGWLLRKKWNKGLAKANGLFLRYGYWSVAATRPFGLGNYISYIAGMAKMNLKSYLFLTFVGIYPWSYSMLLVGKYFNGNFEAVRSFFQAHSHYLLLAAAVPAAIGLCFLAPVAGKKIQVGLITKRGGRNNA